jgi:hypothetical protein
MRFCAAIILLLVLAAPAQIASGQTSASETWLAETSLSYFPMHAADDDADTASAGAALPLPRYGSWVSITKWATLATSIALGAYGFKINTDANDIFDNLEDFCQSDPDNCRSRNPDGSYADPRLESIYQEAVDKDNQARTLLIASQVFFGATVVLFIVDFQKDEGPGNVPYEPEDDQQSSLRITAVPGSITVRYYIM